MTSDDAARKSEPGADPEEEKLVCGRRITTSRENYYAAEYQGRSIYFCTTFCLETFLADPDRFYIAHSRRKDGN